MLRVLVAVGLVVAVSIPALSVTVDEIIANNLEARGGRAAIKAITTLKVSGRLSMEGMETSFTQYYKNGVKTRMDIDVQGQTMVTAFDGTHAWADGPFTGGKPRLAPANETDRARSEADFMGDFADTTGKGLTMSVEGTADIDGATAYIIKTVRRDSSISTTYIDAITWLEVKTVTEVSMNGTTVPIERKVSDYKNIGGVLVPMSNVVFYNGNEAMSMKWEGAEVNVPMDDTLFTFPGSVGKE